MATFYEGNPILTFSFTVEEAEYASAYLFKQQYRSFFHRKEWKGGLCVTAAVCFAAMIPSFQVRYGSFWFPAAAMCFCFLMGAYFFFLQPEGLRKFGAEIYRSNLFLRGTHTVSVYRDSMVYKTEREVFSQYWTDFDRCIETEDQILLIGGVRDLMILKKDGISGEQQKQLSAHFASAFASRYRVVKR